MAEKLSLFEAVGFTAAKFGLAPLSRALGSGVGPSVLSVLANPIALGLIWLGLLKIRGERWRDAGFFIPRRWFSYLLLGLLLFFAVFAFKTFVNPLIVDFAERYFSGDGTAQGRDYAFIEGDPAALLKWVALVWVFAAIGEELFFRGLLLTRLERVFGGGALAAVMAIAVQAALFGLHHWSSGSVAMLTSGAVGVLYGAAFMAFRKNLVPLIVAHGLWDTFGLTMIYFGAA